MVERLGSLMGVLGSRRKILDIALYHLETIPKLNLGKDIIERFSKPVELCINKDNLLAYLILSARSGTVPFGMYT